MLLCALTVKVLARPVTAGILSLALIATAGCSAGNLLHGTLAPVSQATVLGGIVHGGQQPISGATVQLWAVGTSDGGPATPLLSPAITSAANGTFTFGGQYTCPSASTLVYLTATGGNPGLSSGTNNPAITLMAALGTCGSLSASTYAYMNEVTTVGSVFALAPYMTSYSHVGASGSHAAALADAFSTANELVDISKGTPGGNLPSGYGVDATLINTIADILAACINSDGSTASTAPCGKLFNLTGGVGTTNVAMAALQMARNPTSNTVDLYDLILPNAPFTAKATAPDTLTLAVSEQVEKPVISPNGGTFSSAKSVTIADTTAGAAIYYTTDGTNPQSSGTRILYSTSLPINVALSETVSATAIHAGYMDSDVVAATFTITSAGNATGPGVLTTVAGNFVEGNSGDGGQATSAELGRPFGVAVASDGTIYIVDNIYSVVRKVAPDGVITTVAGGGTANPGLGGLATDAQLNSPAGIAFDKNGNLYIGEIMQVVKVDKNGILSAVAGDGTFGFNGASTPVGDGGPATSGHLYEPYGMAFDSAGNLYIAEFDDNRVRKVTTNGIISTIAGTGACGAVGDGGPATSATICSAFAVAVDGNNNVYVSDQDHYRVRKIDAAGMISTVAGTGACTSTSNGGQATSVSICSPQGLAIDSDNNLYFADFYNFRIRKVTTSGIMSTVAGNGSCYDYSYSPGSPICVKGPSGEGGYAIDAGLGSLRGIALDASGNLFFADSDNYAVRKVTH